MLKVLIPILFVLFPIGTLAQDFEKGLAAVQTGDFVTALNEWMPLANQDDATAQVNIGIMYSNGQGVLKNNAEAVRWYRLAAD